MVIGLIVMVIATILGECIDDVISWFSRYRIVKVRVYVRRRDV